MKTGSYITVRTLLVCAVFCASLSHAGNVKFKVVAPPAPDYLLPPTNITTTFNSYSGTSSTSSMTMSSDDSITPPSPPGGGTPGTNAPTPPDTRRNALKFMEQQFSLLDTNAVAGSDPNLYNGLLSIPPESNPSPNLQIAPYGTNAVIIKANHFDYSQETSRNFALLVCDKADTATWKNIDLAGAYNAVDGWLVQGTVANWKVTDPMYLLVTNIVHNDNAFYQAIPYGGAQVAVSGVSSNQTVSNIINFQVSIRDLSGVTNELFHVDVSGLPARYTTSGNTVTLDTHYNPNSIQTLNVDTFNGTAAVFDTNNVLDNSELYFNGGTSLPVDFENSVFLAFQSDNAVVDIGTNYTQFGLEQAATVTARVYDPSSGQILSQFSQAYPAGSTVAVPWNFTEPDGVTPYTNDTYAVSFQAAGVAMVVTNDVNRDGYLRPGGGCLLSYQYEDPSTVTGTFLNNDADTAIGLNLLYLFNAQYDPLYSITQYTAADTGPNRNFAQNLPYKNINSIWKNTVGQLTNTFFSELTIAQAHGTGGTIGASKYLPDSFQPQDLNIWCVLGGSHLTNSQGKVVKAWRLRKAILTACFTGVKSGWATAGGVYFNWQNSAGIRDAVIQNSSYCYKNCGLFFEAETPQGSGNSTTADFSELVDQAWVCGKLPYPGGCSPTYSFTFAATAGVKAMPWIKSGKPFIDGFGWCVYTINQDQDLMQNNIDYVNQ